MNSIFFRILNMSIMAGLLSIVVMLLRLLLKRVPKWTICLLWAIVGLRLLIPFNIESPVSLMPGQIANGTYVQGILVNEQKVDYSSSPQDALSEKTVYQDAETPAVYLDTETNAVYLDTETNLVYQDTETNVAYQDAETQSQSNPEIHSEVSKTAHLSAADWLKAHLWMIWAAGLVIMLLYALFSFFRLKLKLKTSIRVEDTGGHIRVYANDDIVSPFLLGIIRPIIYVPSSLYADKDSSAFRYVLEHERAHISRGDHIWKPLGFLLLSINWFNPLLWLSYILLCRDIEAACDEKVIKDLTPDERSDYSRTLLAFSSPRREIAACPVAFGENGTKNRIKAVLKYKKPALWTVITAIVICIAAAVCLLTIRSEGNNEEADAAISPTDEFSAIEMTEEPDPAFPSTLVNEAIGVLAENSADYWWDSNNPDKEYTLDIRSTRIICIRDDFDEAQEESLLSVQEELFGNVRYIIEFYVYSDLLDSTYSYPTTTDVIIYDDGNMEWSSKGYLQKYVSRTFSNDFSAIIDQVIDLHEEYNQVIHFQNHEIFFEKPE